ncbi:hypothetical protein RB9740 [Rhodopirellula baltica SH 1]|uniref:Uncharacterized protein n=1 Tax=Rhodopirellula baltica (strain DSM 10527 / NCIMB 13988 / SH1) TaxID=243090 RepID=Q7UL48_RHOBA|nr:hypothetical protein RB9740 [Rhodopirellula baltica SH 1]
MFNGNGKTRSKQISMSTEPSVGRHPQHVLPERHGVAAWFGPHCGYESKMDVRDGLTVGCSWNG